MLGGLYKFRGLGKLGGKLGGLYKFRGLGKLGDLYVRWSVQV